MQRLISVISIYFISLLFFSAIADDIIVMRNGDIINANVMEITPTEIKYKKASRPNGPTYSLNKAEVLAINYEDGDKDVFDAPAATSTVESREQTIEANKAASETNIEAVDAKKEETVVINAAEEANKVSLEKFNNVKIPVYTKDDTEKNADMALAIFGATPESVLADDILEVSFKSGFREFELKGQTIVGYKTFQPNPRGDDFIVILHNKSNKMVYVDLQNSFVRNCGNAYSYYTPTATTNSNTTSGGVGVNLGVVTPALSGVTVGGGQAHTTSTTVFSQRYVQIPPKSTVELDAHNIWVDETSCSERIDIHNKVKELANRFESQGWYIKYGLRPGLNFSKEHSLKRGEHMTFTPEDFGFRFGGTITYSEDPNFKRLKSDKLRPLYKRHHRILSRRHRSDI